MSLVSLRSVVKANPNEPALLGAPSWTALLASTTLGLDPLGRRRVTVQCDLRLLASENYRLVVHLYDVRSLEHHPAIGRRLPRASAQRAVTSEELKRGVDVTLLEPVSADDPAPAGEAFVVAWVELGVPDLDFDGAEACPESAAYLGRSEILSLDGNARVLLRRQAA